MNHNGYMFDLKRELINRKKNFNQLNYAKCHTYTEEDREIGNITIRLNNGQNPKEIGEIVQSILEIINEEKIYLLDIKIKCNSG